jgi:hypothetical protein
VRRSGDEVTQRPTTLRLFSDRCPWAVELYERGAPMDRRHFWTGTAAHDVLHALGEYPEAAPEAVARDTCTKLISGGRVGVDAEPPLAEAAVWAGRDLAMAYVQQHPLSYRSPRYEVGLAFDDDWHRLHYDDPDAAVRCRLDVSHLVTADGEYGPVPGICATDYKTSWHASADDLDSIQMKMQSVALWLSRRSFASHELYFVRREIVNLRTGRSYSADVEPGSDDTIERWQADIMATVKAAAKKPRIANPGPGCLRCDYVAACEHNRDYVAAGGSEDLARQWCAAEARAKALAKLVREAAADEPIPVDGSLVGFRQTTRATIDEDDVMALWSMWAGKRELTPGLVRGFIAAAKLAATQARGVLRALYKDKDKRAIAEAALLTQVGSSKFGAWKGSK